MTWEDRRYIAANTHREEECKSSHVPNDDRSSLYAPNLFLIGSFREVVLTCDNYVAKLQFNVKMIYNVIAGGDHELAHKN